MTFTVLAWWSELFTQTQPQTACSWLSNIHRLASAGQTWRCETWSQPTHPKLPGMRNFEVSHWFIGRDPGWRGISVYLWISTVVNLLYKFTPAVLHGESMQLLDPFVWPWTYSFTYSDGKILSLATVFFIQKIQVGDQLDVTSIW